MATGTEPTQQDNTVSHQQGCHCRMRGVLAVQGQDSNGKQEIINQKRNFGQTVEDQHIPSCQEPGMRKNFIKRFIKFDEVCASQFPQYLPTTCPQPTSQRPSTTTSFNNNQRQRPQQVTSSQPLTTLHQQHFNNNHTIPQYRTSSWYQVQLYV